MITFSPIRLIPYFLERLAQSRPGKNFLFTIPAIIAIAATVLYPLYTTPLIVHAIGSIIGQITYKMNARDLPLALTNTIKKMYFVPKHLHIIYLIVLAASLSCMHLSPNIAIPVSFFTAVFTGYVYDERDKPVLIYNANQPQPIVYT